LELKAKMKPRGATQDILTLFVTLFLTFFIKKFKTLNLPLASQIKWNLSLTPLASLQLLKKIVSYRLDFKKYLKNVLILY